MLTVQCECGKVLRLSERFSGRLGKCPACGKTIRIPIIPQPSEAERASPPPGNSPAQTVSPQSEQPISAGPQLELQALAAAASARPRRGATRPGETWAIPGTVPLPASAENTAAVVVGLLMLATIFIPWATHRDKVAFSWDLMKAGGGGAVVVLIGLWTIGLGCAVVGLTVRGLPAAITFAACGGAGVILQAVTFLSLRPSEFEGWADVPSEPVALSMFSGVVLLLYVVAGNLRLRLGGLTAIRILQAISGGVTSLLTVVGIAVSLSNYGDLPPVFREAFRVDVVIGTLLNVVLVLAGILGLVHAAAGSIRTNGLSIAAMVLVYANAGAAALYLLIRAATIHEFAGVFVLLFLNVVILLFGVCFLLCSGTIRTVVLLVRQARGPVGFRPPAANQTGVVPQPAPAEPAAAAGQYGTRLAELDSLRRRGAIGEAEYAAERARILREI